MLAAPGFLTIAAFRDLTAHRVREQLAHYVGGKVLRFELPLLPALQFVCTGIREGGVTTSLALDTHGKSLSSRLLALELPGWCRDRSLCAEPSQISASTCQCEGMRVLVLGGTWFLGRRVVERLCARGDEVLVVHRGLSEPDESFPPAAHLHIDRHRLAERAGDVRRFGPDAVVDTSALTGAAVDAVVTVLPDVPTVVLSSQDVYQAHAGLRAGRCDAPVPLDEGSELRRERYPYRGLGIEVVPEDYDKLDVEERWLARGAVVLRLPLVYGQHDWQRREDIVLRRLRAGRRRIPIGAANLLWPRGHVDDLATGVLAALDTRAADGLAVNLGEPRTLPLRSWLEQILAAADSNAELVRVPEEVLPVDLALTAAHAQHLLVSVARAEQLLGWAPADPAGRVIESVRWHLEHPPAEPTWTEADAHADDHALAQA